LIGFESIVKETDRLTIRPARIEDYKIILVGLQGQRAQQNIYDEEEMGLAEIYTKTFFGDNVQAMQKQASKDIAYLFRVFKKDDGRYIGGVIIKTILRKNFQWAEVGYWLLNQHWGRAYGAEMLKGAVDIAFNELDFHRVEAHINMDNAVSQKTAARAGMELECIRKGFICEEGIWTDNMIYVITTK
jgi:Acetyltransferases, including N-acetylases of ribosomal proteins